MDVLRGGAVITEHTYAFCQVAAVRHHGAAIAHGAQVLGGVKAERRGVAQTADPASLVTCAMCLCGVLYYYDAQTLSNVYDGVRIRRLAVEMDRYNGLRACRDRVLQ